MREELWTKHDLRSRDDLNMVGFFREYGALGYGFYWIIVEQLYYENLHRIELSSKNLANLALLGLASIEQTTEIIKGSVKHEVFRLTDGFLTSPKVDREMSKKTAEKKALGELRAAAGRKGLEKRYSKSAGVSSKAQQTLANASKPSQTDRERESNARARAPGTAPREKQIKPLTGDPMLDVIIRNAQAKPDGCEAALKVIPAKYKNAVRGITWQRLATDTDYAKLLSEFNALQLSKGESPSPASENAA